MRGGGLRVLVAVVALLVLALWAWRPGAKRTAVDRQPAAQVSQSPRVDLAPVAAAREPVEPTASISNQPAPTLAQEGPARYDFDLTVIPIDGSGRAYPSIEVRVGLDLHALALLGTCDWKGELHANWRSSEPTVDLVLAARRDNMGSSTLRHVHLIAEKPETVRLAVDINSVPLLAVEAGVQGMRRGSAGESTLDEGVDFKHDSSGDGVFVDPTLFGLPSHGVEEPWGNFGDPSRWPQFPEPMGSLAAPMPNLQLGIPKTPSAVDVTVVDEKGDPIPSVLITVLHHGGGGAGNSGPRGHLRMRSEAGPARVVTGGGLHATVCQDLELEDGETRVLVLRCPKLTKTRLRLLDRTRQPLSGWHLESRESDASSTFVDRDDTNAEGRAEIMISEAGHGYLFARPFGLSTLPKLGIDTRSLDRNADNDIVLDQFAKLARIRATIIAPDSKIEVRLWNTDSDEGMRLPPPDVSRDERTLLQRHVFHADNLVPGTYMLEMGAPCVEWKRIGPFLLASGQELDAGTYSFDEPAKLKVAGIASTADAKVTVRGIEHGLRLIGEADVSQETDTLSLTPGEWTLSAKSADANAPKVLFPPRVIKAQSGRTLVLDSGESSPPR